MTEAQALITLSFFLKDFARSQYDAEVEWVFSEEGGATCWPKVLQYHLRSYAENKHVSAAITDFRAVEQH